VFVKPLTGGDQRYYFELAVIKVRRIRFFFAMSSVMRTLNDDVPSFHAEGSNPRLTDR
jgi:hypothetical protein